MSPEERLKSVRAVAKMLRLNIKDNPHIDKLYRDTIVIHVEKIIELTEEEG